MLRKPNLILVMGPQASGKTTYTSKFMEENPGYNLIYADLFWPRDENGRRYWIDHDGNQHCWHTEPMPEDIRNRAYRWAYGEFLGCLMNKKDIIMEATLVTKKHRKHYIKDAMEEKYYIKGIFFYPSLLTCAQRNAEREDSIPDIPLARTYSKIVVPTVEEGFDEVDVRRIT